MAKQYDESQQAALLFPGEKQARTKDRLNKESLIRGVSNYTLDHLEKSFSQSENHTVDESVRVYAYGK